MGRATRLSPYSPSRCFAACVGEASRSGRDASSPLAWKPCTKKSPNGKAEGHRGLHAKLVILRGPATAIALLGSANFTNTGFGVASRANLEASLLVTCPARMLNADALRPPLVEAGAVDWSTCGSAALAPPAVEPDVPLDWPAHLIWAELEIDWDSGLEPTGRLRQKFSHPEFLPTSVLLPLADGREAQPELLRIESYPAPSGLCTIELDPAA